MIKKLPKPPPMAQWLISWLFPSRERPELLGDYEEYFAELCEHRGELYGRFWYCLQIVYLTPIVFLTSIQWSYHMVKNFVKYAFRILRKHKGYSLINMAGLAVGIACSGIILLYVTDELSYDRFHKNAHRIYRIQNQSLVEGRTQSSINMPANLAATMLKEFPEVESAARFGRLGGYPVFRYQDKTFSEERVYCADSEIFNVLTFSFLKGTAESALGSPNAIVLTASSAKKYFGSEDPMGKTINSDNRYNYIVTAVIDDIPQNAHFHCDFILPLRAPNPNDNWLNLGASTYVLLKEGFDVTIFTEKMDYIVNTYLSPFIEKADNMPWDKWLESGNKVEYVPIPLTDIHLHSNYNGEMESNGSISTIYFVSILAIAILIIACFNYINLETARASKRFKEMGMRKALGSNKRQIFCHMLTESLIMSGLSFTVALIITWFLLPGFNHLFDKALTLNLLNHWMTIPGIVLMAIFMGLLTGVYPSMSMAHVRTAEVIKGAKALGRRKSPLRSTLVVFQFAASIFIIIATLTVFNQIQYSLNMKLGFNQNQLMVIRKVDDIAKDIQAFKRELLDLPGVSHVTKSTSIPGQRMGSRWHRIYGDDIKSNLLLYDFWADIDYMDTYQLEIKAGRNYSNNYSAEVESVLLNETAVAAFGLKDPVGKFINPINTDMKLQVIGVVKDFHFGSVHAPIQPIKINLLNDRGYGRYLTVRIESNQMARTIEAIQKRWHHYAGNQAFEYSFMDKDFESLYQSEKKLGNLFSVFSILAVFIACLGLFGLAYFTINERVKEIGIRKILGASIPGLVVMLLKNFTRWIGMAVMLAWPLTYFIMTRWLQRFAYRTHITIESYLISAALVFIIALLSVSLQSIRAARSNPINSLRYE